MFRLYIYIYIYILKIEKNYTSIPTSLFREACRDESGFFLFSIYILRSTLTYRALYFGKSKHKISIYIHIYLYDFR